MTEKKEKFRVKRAWIGGPDVGAEIELKVPVNPSLLPNVELILNGVTDTSKAESKAAEIIADAEAKAKAFTDEAVEKFHEAREAVVAEAKAEAAKILDQARSDADGILNGAKAEAAKMLEEAKASNSGNKNHR